MLLVLRDCFIVVSLFLVEDMIKEVDVDGDGRIDFYGKDAVLLNLLNLFVISTVAPRYQGPQF